MTTLEGSNFFKFYMFHPTESSLKEEDQKKAWIATIAFGILTLGIGHLICRLFFYDRKVTQLNSDPKVQGVATKSGSPLSKPAEASQSTKQEGVSHTPKARFGNIDVEVNSNDILEMDVDAVVNAANQGLKAGNGICGQIRKKGGPKIFEECTKYLKRNNISEVEEGHAMMTKGGDLPRTKHVIHAVGPRIDKNKRPTKDQEDSLFNAYYNSLVLANDKKLTSIAFPSISTGIFNFPKKKAAEIAMRAFKEFAEKNPQSSIKKITMSAMGDALPIFTVALECERDWEEPSEYPSDIQKVSCTAALKEENGQKNRYGNILPYDNTLVKLSDNNYINANFVHKHMIIAQGPLQETMVDFNKMIEEHQVRTVVAVGDPEENEVQKYHDYFSKVQIYDPYRDYHTSPVEDFPENYITKRDMKKPDYRHLHVTGWNDFSAASIDIGLNIVKKLLEQIKNEETVVLHCSAGAGRTGTIAATIIAYLEVERLKVNDLEEIAKIFKQTVQDLRSPEKGRCHMMVQAKEQYKMGLEMLMQMRETANGQSKI